MFDDHYAILNIGDLLSRAQKFSESIINNKNDHLYAFNTYLEAIMKSGGLPSVSPLISNKNDCITVNTVHGVKGGEFNIVFLKGLLKDLLSILFLPNISENLFSEL